MSMLQAPFELPHRDNDYRSVFDASSPLSSPTSLYEVDSSPPSSPINGTLDIESDEEPALLIANREILSDTTPDASPPSTRRSNVKGKGKLFIDLETSPAHPFSASTRAIKRPPCYSKDAARPKMKRQKNEPEVEWDVFGMQQRARIHDRDGYVQSIVPSLLAPTNIEHDKEDADTVSPSQDSEQTLWEDTLAGAVDGVECKIDLSGHNLTYIPAKISDLSRLVVIPDSNAPGRELVPRRTCSKSTNSVIFGTGKLGHREGEIHLFFARNRISSLPNELFNLDALVVLSLRANNLTEIPPLIGQLRNLRELNVANNKLHWLPSEILSLKLVSLAVDPNPFEENPYAKLEPSKERWFGPIQRKYTIAPLVELVMRRLLAPSVELYALHGQVMPDSGFKCQETVLEHSYDLPLQSDYAISPALRRILSSCVPKSIASSQSPHAAAPYLSPEARRPSSRTRPRPCVSTCPSPKHLDISRGKYRRPVFVTHSEERLSWEKHIASLAVGGETGIPVRWRGCSMGCLDYLDQTGKDVSISAPGAAGEEDWSIEMEVDKQQSNGENDTTSTVRSPSINAFKVFDPADIDLDD